MKAKRRAGRLAGALGLVLATLASAPTVTVAGGGRPAYVQRGEASYYGPGLHGRRMADGRRLDRHELTAAHRELPLGSRATVTNLANGRTVEVEISDRGPYVEGRVIDLSEAAAARVGFLRGGGTPPGLGVGKPRE